MPDTIDYEPFDNPSKNDEPDDIAIQSFRALYSERQQLPAYPFSAQVTPKALVQFTGLTIYDAYLMTAFAAESERAYSTTSIDKVIERAKVAADKLIAVRNEVLPTVTKPAQT